MLKPIFALSLVNVLGFTLLIPVFPYVVEQYHGGAFAYGLLLTCYPLFQFFGAPILGTLSDHYGRRPILIISQLGTLLSWFVFASAWFVPNITVFGVGLPLFVLGFSRIVDGATGGNIAVATAFVADVTTPKTRTKIFGFIGAVVGVGLMIGPAIGGFTSDLGYGYLGPAVFAILLSTFTLIWMIGWLPESLKPENRSQHYNFHLWSQINVVAKIAKFENNNMLFRMLNIRLFFNLAFNSYTAIVSLVFIQKFNLNPTNLGVIFLILGLFLIVNQGFVVNWVSQRLGDLRTFYIGQWCMMGGFILYTQLSKLWMLFPISYIANLGFSLGFPTFKAILTNATPDDRQGEVTGLDESIVSLSSAIAPVLSSVIYKQIGMWCFVVFAGFLFVPYAYLRLLGHRKRLSRV